MNDDSVYFFIYGIDDLLSQQRRRRELCTELKIHSIEEIRLSKEIRLKDYIFFPHMATFSTSVSV